MSTTADERARASVAPRLDVLDELGEARLDRVTTVARDLFGMPIASINLMDGAVQYSRAVVAPDGMWPESLPRQGTMCDVTVSTAETLVVEDRSKDERFKDLPLVTGEPHLRFYAGHPVTTPSGRRVGTICILDSMPHSFSADEQDLLRNLASWVQSELSMEEELERAGEVQRGLLPQRTLDLPGFELAGACSPARGVGGDFFDWYSVIDGAQITLGDVMGKGMGAALLAATVRAVLRGARRLDPAAAVGVAADSLTQDLEAANSFVTLFHARVLQDGLVEYVDAGHGLGRVVRADGTHVPLPSTDPPVGLFEDDEWTAGTIRLEPDDALLVASDGLLDHVVPGEEADRVLSALVTGGSSAQEIVDFYMASAARGPRTDDTTQVVLRRIS